MTTRPLLFLVLATLLASHTVAADNGPGAHARGGFDAATGVYTVVSGDTLGAIAARFGMSLAQIDQQNDLSTNQIQVGQKLVVAPPSMDGPWGGNTGGDNPPVDNPTAQATQESTPAAAAVSPDLPPDPWPRKVQALGRTLLVYQPQVESWDDNQLKLRSAVAIKSTDYGEDAFGVIQAQARTQVDREQRMVVLQDLAITKADFPTLPELANTLATDVSKEFGSQLRIIPLDRLEASLGIAKADPGGAVAVRNPVPRVIVSQRPAILVPIQGSPVLKPAADSDTPIQRIINTRAVILTTGENDPYYLHLLDGWVTAPTLAGPWVHAEITPAGIDAVASQLAARGEADLLNGNPSTPTVDLLAAGIPDVYVSQTPTELIVFKGQPDLVPIDGTALLRAKNTSADVFVDTDNNNYYALMAGRWYRAAELNGPWAFVASTDLPADFKQIPPDSPAGVVLSTVAGTPQAREAVIANSIPQTATIARTGSDGPVFTAKFDGPPTIGLLKGTDLEYAVNSETPIIRVDGETYYALQDGVWFQSPSFDGPWALSTAVPDAIYQIPPSSPLHYVTYVRIYDSTPEAIYEGYTPGYLGTVQTDDGVVVYGTGYDYQPWIGDAWYAAPETFGLAAQPVYNPAVGYAFGFGLGLATAAMAEPYWGGAYYRPYDMGYGCCGLTSANVYRQWGNTVAAGTRTWYDSADGTLGTAARGDYTNWRTGTSGRYAAGRSYNPYTGVAQRGYGRTFDTAGGVDGAVARGGRYNPATGVRSYGSRMAASGPEGGYVSRDTERASGPLGGTAAAHQTTVSNPRTGETRTLDTARVGNNLYAGADGNVYRSTSDGWQRQDDGGWQDAGDAGWADREQQARSLGDDRLNSGFGFDDRFGGDGFGDGDVENRFGGGGSAAAALGDGLGGGDLGGRFGDGGLAGNRFGGGGFGGRFGGGGFGGRFHGRR